MDGILVIDKPTGLTSHDVVAAVRRLTGETRVGHAGTLDPTATGVLPVLVGRATKVSDFMMRGRKGYAGTIRFGIETDTLDAAGKTLSEISAIELEETAVRRGAAALVGRYDQVPPIYSAIKVKGRALHKSARQGIAVAAPAARPVEIFSFEITRWRGGEWPEADFAVVCSKGTYVRSLARDLGNKVGYPAILSGLRRTRSGVFELRDAVALNLISRDNLAANLRPIKDGLSDLPAVTVPDGQVPGILNGGGLDLTRDQVGSREPAMLVLDAAGRTLAVHEVASAGRTRPIRVIGEGIL